MIGRQGETRNVGVGQRGRMVATALGSEAVVLLYNRDRQQIGLRAARPDDRHAYKLRRPQNQSTWLVNAGAFLKHYDLEELKGQAFPANVEEELVVVDLQAKR